MHKHLLSFLIFLASVPIVAQVPDTSDLKLVGFEQLMEYSKFSYQLQFQHRNRKKRHTVRENAIVRIQFRDGSELPVGRLKLVSPKGIYVATYGILNQKEQRWEDYPDLVYTSVGTDSIAYFPLAAIKTLYYRNAWERQSDWSKGIYIGGFFVGLVPSSTEALINGELRNSTWGLVGAGLVMATVGYLWNRKMGHLRDHSESEWKLSIALR
ncbi:MAG: hypothetical protein ACFB10_03070 [Salibacteraceae bacterium]